MANRSLIILAVVAFLSVAVGASANDWYYIQNNLGPSQTQPNFGDAADGTGFFPAAISPTYIEAPAPELGSGVQFNIWGTLPNSTDSLAFNQDVATWLGKVNPTLNYTIGGSFQTDLIKVGTQYIVDTSASVPVPSFMPYLDSTVLYASKDNNSGIAQGAATLGNANGTYIDATPQLAYGTADIATLGDHEVVKSVIGYYQNWDYVNNVPVRQDIYAPTKNLYFTQGKSYVDTAATQTQPETPAGFTRRGGITVAGMTTNSGIGQAHEADIVVSMAYSGPTEFSTYQNDPAGFVAVGPINTYKLFASALTIAQAMLYGDSNYLANNNLHWDVNTGNVMNASNVAVFNSNVNPLRNFLRYVFDIKGLVVQDVDLDGEYDADTDYVLFTVADDATYCYGQKWQTTYSTEQEKADFGGQYFDGKTVFMFHGTTVTTFMDPTSNKFFGSNITTDAGTTMWNGVLGAYGVTDYQINGLNLDIQAVPEPSSIMLIAGAALALGAGMLRRRVR